MALADLRLWFAFGAGSMTFFAPCAYPLLPGYLAYYLGDREGATRWTVLRRAAAVSLVASAGMFAVYLGLVGVVVGVGTRYLDRLVLVSGAVGVGLVLLGVATLAGYAHRSSLAVALPERRRSYRGYFAFGVAYAVAAAGCTAPWFVAVVLSTLTADPAAAVLTVVAYAGGMAAMLALVTALTAVGRGAVLRVVTARGRRLEQAAGVVLVLAGLVQLYAVLFRYGGLALLGLE